MLEVLLFIFWVTVMVFRVVVAGTLRALGGVRGLGGKGQAISLHLLLAHSDGYKKKVWTRRPADQAKLKKVSHQQKNAFESHHCDATFL